MRYKVNTWAIDAQPYGSDVDAEPEPEPEPQGKGKGKGKGKQVTFQPRAGRGGGRRVGSNTWTTPEQWQLCGTILDCLPRSEQGWKRTAKTYNRLVPPHRQRTAESLKGKYTKLLKMKKPTGEGKASKLHEEALAIKDLLHAQEEAHAIDDPWSALDVELEPGDAGDDMELGLSGDELPLPPPGSILARVPALAPAPTAASAPAKPRPWPITTPVATSGPTPALAPARAPFARPKSSTKPTATKAVSGVAEQGVIQVSSSDSSDFEILPNSPSIQKKEGSAYRATRVTEEPLPKVRQPPCKHRKTAQATAERIMDILTREETAGDGHDNNSSLARVEIFGRDRTIERLEQELSASRERCHQLERQVDQLSLVMTLSGLVTPSAPSPVPTAAPANGMNSQSLATTLANFLRPQPAAVVPAPAVPFGPMHFAPAQPIIPASPFAPHSMVPVVHHTPTTPVASTLPPDAVAYLIDPALSNGAKQASERPPVASASGLSPSDKVDVPTHPEN